MKTESNVLFLDAYNANPTSMQAAIENFAAMKMQNKFLILGDMLELGEESEKEHVALLELLSQKQLMNTVLVGNVFANLSTAHEFKTYKTVEELLPHLDDLDLKNMYILIKGSRGIKLEKAVEKL